MVVDWIWRLCNMAFERDAVPEDWKCAVIVPLYKGKGKRSECKNYRGISLLSVVGKVYAGILVDRVCRVTEHLIDDEQRRFQLWKGCVVQIFTLKEVSEKKRRVYIGLMDLEVYDRVNREPLWQVLRMYYVGGKLLSGIESMLIV